MRPLVCFLGMILFTAVLSAGEAKKNPSYTDPEKADADFKLQGEYTGEITKDGNKAKVGVQVIAMGDGKFRAVYHAGGLPGDGYDMSAKQEVEGTAAELKHPNWTATIKEGSLTLSGADGKELGTLKRVVRESPTLGAKPPEGAVVLFDGKNIDQWQKGARMTEDGLLMEGANSIPVFQNISLHLEFRLPYMPFARGQGRANSGCYPQGRYEAQILDSFGLAGKNNEAGGIYTIKDPSVNMCFPPLQWQTYDIDFTAAEYKDGVKTKNARMTVKLNGVVVQNDTELPKATTSSPVKEGPEPSYLHLQNHGNPVRFRNIWYVEKK